MLHLLGEAPTLGCHKPLAFRPGGVSRVNNFDEGWLPDVAWPLR